MASTQLHHQATLGQNRFFCWPALWHQPSSFFKGPLAETIFLLAPVVASAQFHLLTTLGRNRFFCWPALWLQFSSIFKRPLAETDFFAARLVASTQLHLQTTLGRNRFFCWPALWHQPSSILKRLLAETDFLLASLVAWATLQTTLGRYFVGPPCGRNPVPSSNDPWPKPIFLLARVVASAQFHLQTTLGRNRFFCRPALWHQPSSIIKRPLAETDFFAGPPCGINPAPSSNDSWPKPIFCWPAS